MVPPLLDLVDRRLIRILDVLILVKRDGEDFDAFTTSDLDAEQVGDLGALAGASSGLLSDDDAAAAAATLEPHSVGLLIVYENLWSIPFAVAARKAGGQLVAQGHIPTQALVAALDALDSLGTKIHARTSSRYRPHCCRRGHGHRSKQSGVASSSQSLGSAGPVRRRAASIR